VEGLEDAQRQLQVYVVRRVAADQCHAHAVARRYDDAVFLADFVGGQRLRDDGVQAADDARLVFGGPFAEPDHVEEDVFREASCDFRIAGLHLPDSVIRISDRMDYSALQSTVASPLF
jgi:hypothetical protein